MAVAEPLVFLADLRAVEPGPAARQPVQVASDLLGLVFGRSDDAQSSGDHAFSSRARRAGFRLLAGVVYSGRIPTLWRSLSMCAPLSSDAARRPDRCSSLSFAHASGFIRRSAPCPALARRSPRRCSAD